MYLNGAQYGTLKHQDNEVHVHAVLTRMGCADGVTMDPGPEDVFTDHVGSRLQVISCSELKGHSIMSKIMAPSAS